MLFYMLFCMVFRKQFNCLAVAFFFQKWINFYRLIFTINFLSTWTDD